MDRTEANNRASAFSIILHIMVVFWVSSNLRAPITAVGPVIVEIGNALKLSNFQSSLITSIPLMMFASCSVLISKYAAGKNIGQILLYGLLLLAFGLLLRVNGTVAGLMSGSLFVGLGICVGNVLIPGYIKNHLSRYLGLMTGLFAVSMNLTAAFASGYSIRLGQWTQWGWRGSLGIWTVFILIAVAVLLMDLLIQKRKKAAPGIVPDGLPSNMFRSRQAWSISLYMGLQSVVYYCIVSWLPTVLNDHGMPAEETGWVLFTFQISTIPLTFIGPVIANKMRDQKPMIVFVVVLMTASMLLFASADLALMYPAAVLLGVSNGLAFSLSLLFFSIRTRNTADAIKLSGMAQSIGYLVAACGPPVFGILHDLDSSWRSSFYFLIGSISLMSLFGWWSARDKFV